jgi:hypothetical protein
LFDADGEPMTPTHAIKKGVRYRYYVSRRLITGVRAEGERVSEAGQRLPAAQLERLVVDRLKSFFADPDAVTEALPPRLRDAPRVRRALGAARDTVRALEAGGEATCFDILRPLIARAQVRSDRIDIDLRADLVAQTLLADGEPTRDYADVPPQDATPSPDAADYDRIIRLTIAAALKRAGMEMKFVFDGAEEAAPPDAPLVRLLIRAHSLSRRLSTNPGSSLEDIGAQEGMGAPYAARLMRLNYLAPDIVVAILRGRQPVGLTARKLMIDTRLPLEWSDQRKVLGFAWRRRLFQHRRSPLAPPYHRFSNAVQRAALSPRTAWSAVGDIRTTQNPKKRLMPPRRRENSFLASLPYPLFVATRQASEMSAEIWLVSR